MPTVKSNDRHDQPGIPANPVTSSQRSKKTNMERRTLVLRMSDILEGVRFYDAGICDVNDLGACERARRVVLTSGLRTRVLKDCSAPLTEGKMRRQVKDPPIGPRPDPPKPQTRFHAPGPWIDPGQLTGEGGLGRVNYPPEGTICVRCRGLEQDGWLCGDCAGELWRWIGKLVEDRKVLRAEVKALRIKVE